MNIIEQVALENQIVIMMSQCALLDRGADSDLIDQIEQRIAESERHLDDTRKAALGAPE